MRKILLTLLTIMMGAFLFVITSAQDASSGLDATANACFDGGAMAGRCNDDSNGDGIVTDEEVDWAWMCGWYVIRYNQGLFDRQDVPLTCQILLPTPSRSEIELLRQTFGDSVVTSGIFASVYIRCSDFTVTGRVEFTGAIYSPETCDIAGESFSLSD